MQSNFGQRFTRTLGLGATMKRITLVILACLISVHSYAKVYTFGIVPQQSASRLAQQWGPILDHISAQTGDKIVFSTASDIPTFEQRLEQGDYDFAYMNPYHYSVYSELTGYLAIAKAKDKLIKGIIVVRKDSGITSIEQLANTTLAFPSPAAFAASILTRGALAQSDIPFKPEYVSSHDSVYLSVAKGFYPAGGGIFRTFNSLPSETRDQLTPIYVTEGYTPHAIAVHPRVSEKTRQEVSQALYKLENDPVTLEQLSALNIKGFVPAQDQDWDDVRRLNINLLSQ